MGKLLLTLAEQYCSPSKNFVIKKNVSLKNSEQGNQAYEHLLSSVMYGIRTAIAYVENSNIDIHKTSQYLGTKKNIENIIIDSIIKYNVYTNTFNNNNNIKDYKSLPSTSKYYCYAKDIASNINNQVITITNLNEDSLLAYNLYTMSQEVTNTISKVEDHKLVLNKEDDFVKDSYIFLDNSSNDTNTL